jgi:hypothetical protein
MHPAGDAKRDLCDGRTQEILCSLSIVIERIEDSE